MESNSIYLFAAILMARNIEYPATDYESAMMCLRLGRLLSLSLWSAGAYHIFWVREVIVLFTFIEILGCMTIWHLTSINQYSWDVNDLSFGIYEIYVVFSFHGILKESHDRIEASGFQPPRAPTTQDFRDGASKHHFQSSNPLLDDWRAPSKQPIDS